jgi:hypothetical protein
VGFEERRSQEALSLTAILGLDPVQIEVQKTDRGCKSGGLVETHSIHLTALISTCLRISLDWYPRIQPRPHWFFHHIKTQKTGSDDSKHKPVYRDSLLKLEERLLPEVE